VDGRFRCRRLPSGALEFPRTVPDPVTAIYSDDAGHSLTFIDLADGWTGVVNILTAEKLGLLRREYLEGGAIFDGGLAQHRDGKIEIRQLPDGKLRGKLEWLPIQKWSVFAGF